MVVSQPELPIPMVLEFPFPAWATRPGEAAREAAVVPGGDDPGDPFDGLVPSTKKRS